MMIAGITGGLGCGKSTVARALEARGFRRLDSDQIVRDQVLFDPDVITALRERYGDAVLNSPAADGSLSVSRPTLADRVFVTNSERLWLEELIHPKVFAALRREFATEPR